MGPLFRYIDFLQFYLNIHFCINFIILITKVLTCLNIRISPFSLFLSIKKKLERRSSPALLYVVSI